MSKTPKRLIGRNIRQVWFSGLFLAPILGGIAIFAYYQAYESLRAKYECQLPYLCKIDINGDGFLDTVEVVEDTDPVSTNRYLLQVNLAYSPDPNPILAVEYVNVDNTLRTHVAHVNDEGNSYLVIFDQVNEFQYYRWDGSTMEPVLAPSSHLRNVRHAMGLSDDLGGFGLKLVIMFGYVTFSLVYYLFLFVTTF